MSTQDMQNVAAFVYIRAKEPDEDDNKKLIRLMQSLGTQINLMLTIEPNNKTIWWADRLYVIHPDL